ncbi:hypothetical protein [Nostoc sp. FACHB-110]|uniref:hypothetical protein n=1 Tax=Nostoc sp. FACHB-110 TaxID=2692834 RepID=UPI001684C7BB|nr:hypothetical protein [Nostoc sp. FACHB-110]MBD2438263.1 hypothetical protein [Nostoc sp. FACHB-110]
MSNAKTLLRIRIFYYKLQAGEYAHPYDLAKALEKLADQAWDDVEEIYPNSMLP